MTATFIPNWTDTGTQVIAPQCLVRGNLIRGTLDLLAAPTKVGAYLCIKVGKGGTTALATGAFVRVRRMFNNGGIITAGSPWFAAVTTLTAAILKLINNGAGYIAGTSVFAIDGTGTPAADDTYCFWGVATTPPANATTLPNMEILKCSTQAAGTSITVDSPCKVAKIDNEILTRNADGWMVWCPGGAVYEVIIDYMAEANGEPLAVRCLAQIYNSDQGA